MSSYAQFQEAVWDAIEEQGIKASDVSEADLSHAYDIAFAAGRQQEWHEADRSTKIYRKQAWDVLTNAALQLHAIARTIPGQQHRIPPVIEQPQEDKP